MSTVASRTFASVPQRSASETWDRIVELLTHGKAGAARNELRAVAGVAASIIADKAPQHAPIIVTCDGPRTRIYCLYDDEALEGEVNEDPLGFDPLLGDWTLSLPCEPDDLSWVQASLARQSVRVTARDKTAGISLGETAAASGDLLLDVKALLGS